MLLEASIANCLSYNERQTLSLVASSADEHFETNVAVVQAANKHHVLKTALIYGANASGKSNFLKGLFTMRRLVLSSAKGQRGDALNVSSFKLNVEKRNQPSEFEVMFIAEGVRYQYGFSATADRIHDEWLFAFPKGQAQLWFQRAWDADLTQHVWRFGNNFQGDKALWQRSTRGNALFLSTAVQLNSEQLQPVFDWFEKTLKFIDVDGVVPDFTVEHINKGGKEKVLEYLRAADIPLSDITIKETPFIDSLPQGLPAAVREKIIEDLKGKSLLEVKTQRLDNKNQPVEFSLLDESDGTQRFFSFIGPWIKVLEQGTVLFVDELNNSLHTHLVRLLIQLFHNPVTNPNNAQLVFTTHDTNQLSQEIFRRDQVWFCEKDKFQATQLYPLTDFSPRKGRENLELAYLSGRFGALPFVTELE